MDTSNVIYKLGFCYIAGHTPFRFGFITNGGESTVSDNDPTDNEQEEAPGGIVGFKLNFAQQTCA